MKKHYETPLLETIELSTEGGILENSIFVTMALLSNMEAEDATLYNSGEAVDW